jgi:predicted helicase
VTDIAYRAPSISVLVSGCIADLHLCAAVDSHQCFPFYVYKEDGTNRQENITDWALEYFRKQCADNKIAKWDIFYYVYGVLHHPEYRAKYAENLKRELPRIPLAKDFWGFSKAGKELAGLHIEYEKLEPYPLKFIETSSGVLGADVAASLPRHGGVKPPLRNADPSPRSGQALKVGATIPLSYRVEDKMRLAKDRRSLKVNDSLTLGGIPPESFEYRLGNRSALEWVIDQYQVTEDKRSGIRSDPNRADEPEYIVRLVGQVIYVGLETVRIVRCLPDL